MICQKHGMSTRTRASRTRVLAMNDRSNGIEAYLIDLYEEMDFTWNHEFHKL